MGRKRTPAGKRAADGHWHVPLPHDGWQRQSIAIRGGNPDVFHQLYYHPLPEERALALWLSAVPLPCYPRRGDLITPLGRVYVSLARLTGPDTPEHTEFIWGGPTRWHLLYLNQVELYWEDIPGRL